MSELGDLYQALILDHNNNPRNFGTLEGHTHMGAGHNPLCGDKLVVFLTVANDEVQDITFSGSGCAISKASASLMTTAIKGKSVAEAHKLFESFHGMLTGPEDNAEGLGKLAVFAGVKEFPMRVKCATLSWHTLESALEGSEQPASTE